MSKGKFIVIYGANNLGKSTQVKLLAKNLKKAGKKIKVFKYPIYDLEPTGPKLYKLLRTKHDLSEYEMQKIFTQNRIDFEPEIRKLLDDGYWILAEDYKGTGISWGVVSGISLERMEKLNENLLDTDLAILMDGERFLEAKEKGHRNEEDQGRWERGRKIHLKLAKKYGWPIVNANQDINVVGDDIWKIVKKEVLK